MLVGFAWSVLAPHAAAQGRKSSDREKVQLRTSDGVELMAEYYPVTAGRDSPVVVMLADQGESCIVFRSLATRLQNPEEGEPCAVLAVDLRGQGDSKTQRLPGGAARDLSGEKLGRAGLNAMVRDDMEAVRRFLVEKNDAGELNLNRLSVVGIGMGALIATQAAALDWSAPILNTGKQGQDVKALVLVSPPWKYMGVGMMNALRQRGVRSEVAFLILYGEENKDSRTSAERITKQLEKARGDQPPPTEDFLPTVLMVGGKSSLAGTDWLKQAGSKAEELIVRYVRQHTAEPNHPWVKRRLD